VLQPSSMTSFAASILTRGMCGFVVYAMYIVSHKVMRSY
jgi:hypothetical protein